MSRARFQVYSLARHEVGWRFVASNNRELARSPDSYVDAEQARGAVLDLLDVAPSLAPTSWLDRAGRWRWAARSDGDVVAESSRWYFRRVECDAAMAQFRLSAGSALVARSVVRFTAAGPAIGDLRVAGRSLVPAARRPPTERRGPAPLSRAVRAGARV